MLTKSEKRGAKNDPLVSILIVTHNPGKYLKNTLRSCIEQTYKNTEILILDNNSSEDISERITELQNYRITEKRENQNEISFILCQTVNLSNCKSVKLYQSDTNLGPYNGLNFLLEKAQGDYIAIQDHDDIWHPEKLEKQVDFLEKNSEYIGCGTNTIMYYEADRKYFEYFLGEKNSYTIHPSLVFRNDGNFRYDTSQTEYMCDAWSLKNNLCKGEKCIYNLREPLTLHLVKAGSGNYSYRWHKLNIANIKRVYALHSFGYATLTIGWEILRKILYPILNFIGLGSSIGSIERIPFILSGKKIEKTRKEDWWTRFFT